MTALNETMLRLRLQTPQRMRHLPVSPEGWLVPYFVAWTQDRKEVRPGDGVPDFRVIGTIGGESKVTYCYRTKRCWLCGQPLGVNKVFTIGPMCSINRVTMEPPSHYSCANFAVKACPFLSKPKMKRNEKNQMEGRWVPGIALDRNPGVTLLWITRIYSYDRTMKLFDLGKPDAVEWWKEGRKATREEVMASIESGYPDLISIAKQEGPLAVQELVRRTAEIEPLLPVAA